MRICPSQAIAIEYSLPHTRDECAPLVGNTSSASSTDLDLETMKSATKSANGLAPGGITPAACQLRGSEASSLCILQYPPRAGSLHVCHGAALFAASSPAVPFGGRGLPGRRLLHAASAAEPHGYRQ